ncbi:MAG: YceH family protein [Acidobacteriota bacterium]|nr:YceH family protein [Acidobacteriota bacterium]
MRLPRELDAVEIRVLGCLLEKEQTTPDAYPLSVNALVGACNQKSNRDPVMALSQSDVEGALDRLHGEVMVWPVDGARIRKWRHSLDRMWNLAPATRAVMAVLLVRGAQTAGEIRGRTERMHPFASTSEVEEVLANRAIGEEPLTVHLARQPGQKEARWTHLVGGQPDAQTTFFEPARVEAPAPGLSQRVSELEDRVARLERQLANEKS